MAGTFSSKAHSFKIDNRNFHFDPTTRCSWADGGDLLGPLEQQITPKNSNELSYLVLQLTNACNMNCAYCYESRGIIKNMHISTAKKAINELLDRKKKKHLSIHFFGGEPLLCYDLIKDIVYYSETLRASCDYHISTNGLLLDEEIISFLQKHNFRVLISWDGSIDETCRKKPDGSNATKNVLKSINRTVDSYTQQKNNVQIRITVTRLSKSLSKSINTLLDVGINRFILKDVADLELGFDSQNQEYAFNLYNDLANYYSNQVMTGNSFHIYGRATGFTTILKDLNKPMPRKHGCGCGINRVTLLPEGEYLPCNRYDLEEMNLGCVHSGLSQDHKKTCKSLSTPSNCSECFARLVCGGVCHGAANQYTTWQPPDGEECILTRYRVLRSVALRHQFYEAGISDNLLTGARR